MILVNDLLRSGVFFKGFNGDGSTVFIRTADKSDVIVEHSEHSDIYVCGKICAGQVTDMERSVGIWQCRGYQISLGGIDHNL